MASKRIRYTETSPGVYESQRIFRKNDTNEYARIVINFNTGEYAIVNPVNNEIIYAAKHIGHKNIVLEKAKNSMIGLGFSFKSEKRAINKETDKRLAKRASNV